MIRYSFFMLQTLFAFPLATQQCNNTANTANKKGQSDAGEQQLMHTDIK